MCSSPAFNPRRLIKLEDKTLVSMWKKKKKILHIPLRSKLPAHKAFISFIRHIGKQAQRYGYKPKVQRCPNQIQEMRKFPITHNTSRWNFTLNLQFMVQTHEFSWMKFEIWRASIAPTIPKSNWALSLVYPSTFWGLERANT